MAKVIKSDQFGDVMKALGSLQRSRVLVGIPDSTAGRKDEGEALSKAEIGYIQETGSPANNIPARPFLVPGVAAVDEPVAKHLGKAASFALDDKPDEAEAALSAAGIVAQNSVRATINAGIRPALAESTLKARRRRGRTGEVPLIDKGELRDAITYVLRRK